jgi:DNA-binding response OmpR family regulator
MTAGAYRWGMTSPARPPDHADPHGGGTSVLVVEDDPGIATQLVRGLSRSGYTVDHVTTGREALDRADSDVVLLDLGLPDGDGVDICRQLSQRSGLAIIVVTARGEEPERVLALDAGADDYLVKPFGLAELLARIRAVLRRVHPGGGVTVAGREVALTPKEFDILECLAVDPGRVVSRQEILDRAWDAHRYGPTKVLDVHVAALRRKLGVPGLIEAAYGKGFRLGGQ